MNKVFRTSPVFGPGATTSSMYRTFFAGLLVRVACHTQAHVHGCTCRKVLAATGATRAVVTASVVDSLVLGADLFVGRFGVLVNDSRNG